jgi:hypothetical protein
MLASRSQRLFRSPCARLIATVAVGATLLCVVVSRDAAAAQTPAFGGTWQPLPVAPLVSSDPRLVSVWTGREVVVFDRVPTHEDDLASKNGAVAYDPATGIWRELLPPPGPSGNYEGSYVAAWTGTQVLIGGPGANLVYTPSTGRWRHLTVALGGPMSVWTGREMISWGGGCCGNAFATGLAYNPRTDRARALPPSPLAPAQRPVGAWTGRDLVILVSGLDPNAKRYPASLARAAAYRPATNRWRRIASLPVSLGSSRAVWMGTRFLLVGAGTRQRATLSYNPVANRWRIMAPMPRRASGPAIWTGKRVIVWRGRDALAYNPGTNRWTTLPPWPLGSRINVTSAWTGRSLFVWGFASGAVPLIGEGAVFTPAAR